MHPTDTTETTKNPSAPHLDWHLLQIRDASDIWCTNRDTTQVAAVEGGWLFRFHNVTHLTRDTAPAASRLSRRSVPRATVGLRDGRGAERLQTDSGRTTSANASACYTGRIAIGEPSIGYHDPTRGVQDLPWRLERDERLKHTETIFGERVRRLDPEM